MGILKNGILGSVQGKLGNLVYYTVKGKNRVRTIGKTKKPASAAQLQNQQEMRMVIQFLKAVSEFIQVGFADVARRSGRSAYNMAVSYNKRHAVQGLQPDVFIDFEKVRLTEGILLAAVDATVVLNTKGLEFSWTSPEHVYWSHAHDQVMMLAYFPLLKEAAYVLYGAVRSACADQLPIPPELLAEHMEVYISFISDDRKDIANSSYLGSFNAE